MKAAAVASFSGALEIAEREIPEPGAGEVPVGWETCGPCHITETSVIGSIVGTRQAIAEVLPGQVPARLVFEYAAVPAAL